MKPIDLVIAAILLAAGVGTSWAGQVEDAQELCQPGTLCQIVYTDCTDKGCKRTSSYPCLAKMEEALKALHPFSLLNLDPVTEQFGLDMVKKKSEWHYHAELPYEDPAGLTPYGMTQTMNAKAGQAIVLWNTVKRECFRK